LLLVILSVFIATLHAEPAVENLYPPQKSSYTSILTSTTCLFLQFLSPPIARAKVILISLLRFKAVGTKHSSWK